jgi:hypothetical protein
MLAGQKSKLLLDDTVRIMAIIGPQFQLLSQNCNDLAIKTSLRQ